MSWFETGSCSGHKDMDECWTTRQSLEKIVEAFQKNYKRIRETCFKSEPERGLDAMTYITLFELVKLSICHSLFMFLILARPSGFLGVTTFVF